MANASPSSVETWRGQTAVRQAVQQDAGHSIHSYFNTCPESPDGRWVLYFASTDPEAHTGELQVVDRESGLEKTIARYITTEDAHRVACQQWISKGRRVAFHDYREGEWVIVVVDVETAEERVVATGRQLGWGQPQSDLIPLYGPHWDPGAFRDLELLNVETGERSVPVGGAPVREAYPGWVSAAFGDAGISVFFPILSPDLSRVVFKIASPAGGHFRSSKASVRQGLVCYDLNERRFRFMHEKWGHPAWHPNSREVLNVPNVLIDSDDGAVRTIPGLPRFRASHPSVRPDARLFVTDALTQPEDGRGRPGEGVRGQNPRTRDGAEERWQIVVAGIEGGDCVVVHEAEKRQGARSWRGCHPHPVFSADGKRIYFNVNGPEWTRLYVAEAGEEQ